MLTIRQAEPEDVPILRSIAADAYLPYLPRIGRAPAPVDADYAGAVARGEAFVAMEPGAGVLGLIILVSGPDHLLLENVAVRPSAEGRGIGARLLEFADARARDLRLPEIRLYTNEAMTENLAYYPRRGYTESHRADQDGFRRVFFTRRWAISMVAATERLVSRAGRDDRGYRHRPRSRGALS